MRVLISVSVCIGIWISVGKLVACVRVSFYLSVHVSIFLSGTSEGKPVALFQSVLVFICAYGI